MSSLKNLIGTKLGRYTIVEHLATGGMAEIFLARHEAEAGFCKDLVLKVLQPRWESHPEVVDLFLGEARIAALMNHPNIVDVYDVSCENDSHFIAMEFIRGTTLTQLAKRAIEVSKSIPIDVGVFIAAEVAGALSHMYEGLGTDGHPFHVVHRDISPTNVLISTSGQVKVIDFGIARQGTAVIEASGARPGKVTYMSPEQVTGSPIDGRSDVFCLGTILYEITLGRRLWRGPREVAVRRIVEERPKPPTFVLHDYPAELEIIVLRALEKRPEDRYQSPRELYVDLQTLLEQPFVRLRNNYQMADYADKIFSKEAETLISDVGVRRARAFVEGDELAEPDPEELDFDRQKGEGPGAALAHLLRSSSVRLKDRTGRFESRLRTVAESESPQADFAMGTASGDAHPASSLPLAGQAEASRVVKPQGERADGELTNNGKGETQAKEQVALERRTDAKLQQASARGKKEAAASQEKQLKESAAEDSKPDRLPRRWSGLVLVVALLVAAAAIGALWALYGG